MNFSVRDSGTERTFVVEDFSEEVGAALAALGFTLDSKTATTAPLDRSTRFIDRAFTNLAERLPAMIDQYTGKQPIPWEATLARLVSKLAGSGVEWALIGSTALAARGVAVAPGDIDVVTDIKGASRLADIYSDDIVLPTVEWTGAGWFGRAFDGMRVEWLGNDGVSWTGWSLAATTETVTWAGHVLRVAPVQFQLDIEEVRGRTERAAAIRAFHGHTADDRDA